MTTSSSSVKTKTRAIPDLRRGQWGMVEALIDLCTVNEQIGKIENSKRPL